jgi:uncharacterized protein (DUF608 family)
MSRKQQATSSMARREFLKASMMTAGAIGLGTSAASGSEKSAKDAPQSAGANDASGSEIANAAARGVASGKYNSVYAGERLNRIAFPMGGIGAGMVCLEGTGALSHVSLRNHPDVFNEPMVFAAVCVKGSSNTARVLEGPVPRWKAFGLPDTGNGAGGKTYGLPRFAEATFQTRFPFGVIQLRDKKLPLEVEITGWSPFIPSNADDSSLPAAAMEYRFRNTSGKPIEAVFSFNARNFMARGPQQAVRPAEGGFVLWEGGSKEKPWEQGGFCAAVTDADVKVNHAWFRGGWFDPVTMAWKDVQEGACYARSAITEGEAAPGASLFVPLKLAAGAEKTVTLQLSWYVGLSDIKVGTSPDPQPADGYRPWYSGKFKDLEQVAAYWRDNYARLREASKRFSDCFYDTTLPPEVVEAVAANLTILKSPTVLRQSDGRLWAWEGCSDRGGCCHGSCTHVWNYAQALPHLFPALERTLRETEFEVSQDDRGHQQFRTSLPIRQPKHDFHAAADGQLGGIMKVYREWRISGDTEWARRLWPKVKASMDFCIEAWDPGHKGVVEEPHHNTYDIEFWGPDGMCTSFYLGALHAAAAMGKAVGADVAKYESLFEKGRKFAEAELYDGEYFCQKVEWEHLRAGNPTTMKSMVGGYSPEALELLKKEGPKYQYGKGCLSDGVLGAWMAEVCGVGSVLDEGKVASHLRSVHKYNLKPDLSEHANPQRPSYAIAPEGGLLLCTWPKGGQLSLPFVYSNEVWTGIEYQAAAHMMMKGMVEQGLEVVRAVRDRYDGQYRNPFNEYECGHWYARAMSSYALLQGMSGARYDAVTKTLHLTPTTSGDFRCFLATATGYGSVGVRSGKPFVEVRSGAIEVREIAYQPRA